MSSLTSVALLMAATLGGEPDGVILDFSATWCPPCQQMLPVVKRLQQQGYPIRKVDYDRERDLARRFQIEGLPTFVLVVRGEEQQRYVGWMSESQLRRMAQRIPTKRPEPVAKPTVEIAAQPVTLESGSATIIRANNAEPPKTGEISKDPMTVCVRIRVRDSKGLDIGSGSIIHSEPGRTLILTCGHIFRHFDGRSEIDVDIFDNGRAVSHKGKLIRKDLEADIGLISIQTLTPLRVARVSAEPIRQGQHVFSVGCGGGENPSRLQHRVTSTDRYKGGYIECTGTPIQGRSGGGLFTPDGQIIGVCVFANPGSRRGLYTGLKTIHSLLDQVGLTSLYRDGPAAASPIQLVGAESPAAVQDEPTFEETTAEEPATTNSPAQPVRQLDLQPVDSVTAPPMPEDLLTPRAATPLSDSIQWALNDARGSEVVCIIRPRNNPNAPSRVVIIHEASEQFVAELTGELHDEIRPASIEVRRTASQNELAVPVPSPAAFYGETARRLPVSSPSATTSATAPQLALPLSLEPRQATEPIDMAARRYQRRR